MPRLDLEPGAQLRVRIRARDVALALEPPRASSFLNIFPGKVSEVGAGEGPQVDVLVDIGGAALWARITERSRQELNLTAGQPVHALVKAVAIDSHSFGRSALGGRFLAPNQTDEPPEPGHSA